jgi:hypothetical protein
VKSEAVQKKDVLSRRSVLLRDSAGGSHAHRGLREQKSEMVRVKEIVYILVGK